MCAVHPERCYVMNYKKVRRPWVAPYLSLISSEMRRTCTVHLNTSVSLVLKFLGVWHGEHRQAVGLRYREESDTLKVEVAPAIGRFDEGPEFRSSR
jgi:hypothetical protein